MHELRTMLQSLWVEDSETVARLYELAQNFLSFQSFIHLQRHLATR